MDWKKFCKQTINRPVRPAAMGCSQQKATRTQLIKRLCRDQDFLKNFVKQQNLEL